MLRALLFLALLSLASAAHAVDLGTPAAGTPYDAYMAPVRATLSRLAARRISLPQATALMEQGRAFRYQFARPYVPNLPAVTEARQAGDCKDKALWLCQALGNAGEVRFVVGKARQASRLSHAWVLWKCQGRWYVLDCTNQARPIPADDVPAGRYVALYSWSSHTAFYHPRGMEQLTRPHPAAKVAAAR